MISFIIDVFTKSEGAFELWSHLTLFGEMILAYINA